MSDGASTKAGAPKGKGRGRPRSNAASADTAFAELLTLADAIRGLREAVDGLRDDVQGLRETIAHHAGATSEQTTQLKATSDTMLEMLGRLEAATAPFAEVTA